MEKILKWLDTLKGKKKKWAGCFTWQHVTLGIHSTQRAEAAHSSINIFCSKSSKVVQLVNDLDIMADKQSMKSYMDGAKAMHERVCKSNNISQFASCYEGQISAYAYAQLSSQAAQLIHYECEEMCEFGENMTISELEYHGDEMTYIVKRIEDMTKSKIMEVSDTAIQEIDYGYFTSTMSGAPHITSMRSCSCQYHQVWRLPCRHMMRVAFELKHKGPLPRTLIKVWFLPESADAISNESQGNVCTNQQPFISKTKATRAETLKMAIVPLIELASEREKSTADLLGDITKRIEKLSLKPKEQGTKFIGNPATAKSQHQKRIEPIQKGPTCKSTKKYKRYKKMSADNANKTKKRSRENY